MYVSIRISWEPSGGELSGYDVTHAEDGGLASALARRNATILSPLRYPGSKRRLAEYIRQTLVLNGLKPTLFVEPFAGGASVALQLLNDGAVDSIGLADADPLVAAFWKTVFFDGDWLTTQVETIDVTISRWNELKQSRPQTTRERALACLFLNRTSFSGILAANAGPIGGQTQLSPYKVDCRFPRETLIRRIKQAQSLRSGVRFVWNLPWASALGRISAMTSRGALSPGTVYYLDPPFIRKSARLYGHRFEPADHAALRDAILKLEAPWILSYDFAPEVFELYPPERSTGARVNALYSGAARRGRGAASEAIISNLTLFPEATRLWRTSEEWGLKEARRTRDAATG